MTRFMYNVFSACVISALLLVPGGGAHPGHVSAVGGTFTVNSTADLPDDDVGDGICHTSNGGCTLRAAIDQANFSAGADTIVLPAGVYLLTRPGQDDLNVLGDLDITGDLTIQGAGSATTIVDGNGAVTGDRVFQIFSTAKNTTLSGMTIRNGKRIATFDEGGGLYWDSNGSHLTLNDVVVSSNAGYYGGGIYLNFSMLGDVVDFGHVTVHGNSAIAAAGGIGASLTDGSTFTLHDSQVDTNTAYQGGGVELGGPTIVTFLYSITITNTSIFSNSASLDAGIENYGGSATFPVVVQNSKIFQNSAALDGGGIGNYGSVTIHNTTLDANTATAKGGGIYNYEGGILNINQSTLSRNISVTGGGIYTELFIHNSSNVFLTNTTISGNDASQDGAGIYADSGTVHVYNSTISANQVLEPAGSSYLGTGGGIHVSSNVTFDLENTLIGNNTHKYGTAPAVADDCLGSVYSLGYNLVEETNGCALGGDAAGNISGQDPKLGPLQTSNGLTQVQVPINGSPAINAGETPYCTDSKGLEITLDQRGVPRPESGRCDIGAVESMPYMELMPEVRK